MNLRTVFVAAGVTLATTAVANELTLSEGFTPDPQRVSITSGGTNPASSFSSSCAGWVAGRDAPDLKINWNSTGTLHISATATADVTLVVNDAHGGWHCNDDANGTNPGLTLSNTPSGLIEVWVGSYESGTYNPSTVSVSEIGQFQ